MERLAKGNNLTHGEEQRGRGGAGDIINISRSRPTTEELSQNSQKSQ
jgi:hypothetical protein